MIKMSLSKGNINRTRPQKHQNKSAFKNDLHDTSKKTKILNSLEVYGVCPRCKDIIEWKIKFKKYKPLSAPSKCVACEQKKVKHAYHVLCTECATAKAVCAKCNKQGESRKISEPENKNSDDNFDYEIQAQLKGLTERKRRTILRYIKKQRSNELNFCVADLEKLITDIEKISFTLSDDDGSDGDDNTEEMFK